MKNCDEMVNSLLERREQYVTQQKRKQKILSRTVTSMCCVCLVALLGFGVCQGGWLNSPPDQAIDDAVYPGIKDTFDESKGESADNPTVNNKISIQKAEELPNTARALFALLGDDFISMSRDEINAYYSINIFPTVPSDLKEDDGKSLGIYKRESGTGEIYWDSNGINYSNEDYSRSVYVGVDKDCIPFDFCNLFDDAQSKSVISNIEIGIAQTANGDFYAEFMYEGVGFRVFTSGLTQDELINIVSSLLL